MTHKLKYYMVIILDIMSYISIVVSYAMHVKMMEHMVYILNTYKFLLKVGIKIHHIIEYYGILKL